MNPDSVDVCFLCKKRVYVMERVSAEGLFFHRSCFQCDYCSSTLRLAAYAYDQHSGHYSNEAASHRKMLDRMESEDI
uniref:LIM zinc-binding domain-containing protein n=1 Tax=Seriola dumerili TaxID=41447 RepID=A0A3B4UAM6_SERDU